MTILVCSFLAMELYCASLIRNKMFILDEITWKNASKFFIFKYALRIMSHSTSKKPIQPSEACVVPITAVDNLSKNEFGNAGHF